MNGFVDQSDKTMVQGSAQWRIGEHTLSIDYKGVEKVERIGIGLGGTYKPNFTIYNQLNYYHSEYLYNSTFFKRSDGSFGQT